MRSLKIIVTALVISTVLSGCSRLRQMTRRDYAGMEDPFTSRLTDDDAVAASESSIRNVDPAGQVRTASQSNEMAAGSGPSLSDFVQQADNKVADARQAAAAFGTSAKEAASTDMAGMTQFLGEQAAASGLTETAAQLDEDFAQWAAMQKQEWASKATKLDDQAAPLLNAANAARQSFNQAQTASAGSAFDQAMGSAFGEEEEVATPFIQQASGQRFGDAVNRASSADFAAPAAPPRIEARAPVGVANPFDNLLWEDNAAKAALDEVTRPRFRTPLKTGGGEFRPVSGDNLPSSEGPTWDVTPVAPHQPDATDPFINPGSTTARPKSLDSNFSFDTGWKPSDVVQ